MSDLGGHASFCARFYGQRLNMFELAGIGMTKDA